MNKFRSAVLSGTPGARETPLMAEKDARDEAAAATAGLGSVRVPRSESRTTDQRGADRHRLPAEQATVRHDGRLHEVELINLSGGGAMVCGGALTPHLWDRIDLVLGEYGEIESAVRWIRDNRIGLEFAHETRIDCPADTYDALLREVISRTYPNLIFEVRAPLAETAEEAEAASEYAERRDIRHPLIWSALIHFDHETSIARLRNISASGALVETSGSFTEGSELMLDFGDAGSVFATVGWCRGDQLGLAFKAPFDISRLAQSKPEVAPQRWARPDYLRDETNESSPWATQWGRLTIEEVQQTLSGKK